MWSKLKAPLRRAAAHTRQALEAAIAQALDKITAADATRLVQALPLCRPLDASGERFRNDNRPASPSNGPLRVRPKPVRDKASNGRRLTVDDVHQGVGRYDRARQR